MISIADNLGNVRQRIAQAEKISGRRPGSVTLLAVSKTRHPDEIRAAHANGQSRFGENYLQEALEKMQSLRDLDLEWHFIGPLQSNKTGQVAGHFDWLHTLDRPKTAHRLNRQRPESKAKLNVCIQVNISGEKSKSGIRLEEVDELADIISSMQNLRLRGLMTIPSASHSDKELADCFRQMKSRFGRLQQQYPGIDTLSMGMSDDLETAIAHGSTLVRTGTAIFGPRVASNK
ncbi:MAG: YggS family pyridoxal phosphate-dependent enzyme [Proteobacteria bacterium]|nr:MAG: YggS family pyridoxal phosphate-dependent enzyme [Pseudomonadota bacterium]